MEFKSLEALDIFTSKGPRMDYDPLYIFLRVRALREGPGDKDSGRELLAHDGGSSGGQELTLSLKDPKEQGVCFPTKIPKASANVGFKLRQWQPTRRRH